MSNFKKFDKSFFYFFTHFLNIYKFSMINGIKIENMNFSNFKTIDSLKYIFIIYLKILKI